MAEGGGVWVKGQSLKIFIKELKQFLILIVSSQICIHTLKFHTMIQQVPYQNQ